MWHPSTDLETLRARAEMLARIRAFFSQRSVLEVETPLLSQSANTDPNIDSFCCQFDGPAADINRLYLTTSPEYHMKRLLAAGSGDIFQICKAFRQGELGTLHNPEFTLLEWYRVGFGQQRLMSEVEDLLRMLAASYDALPKSETISYRELFLRHLNIDPLRADVASLQQLAKSCSIVVNGIASENKDVWLDLLLSHVIQPKLKSSGMLFVVDYPASQAALARLKPGHANIAERFELYVHGIEIANGYVELNDAQSLHQRMLTDNKIRQSRSLPSMPIDHNLIAAVQHGLPACSGVALGIDRLFLLMLEKNRLAEVLSFPLHRS